MDLPDSAEYWWNVKGYSYKEKNKNIDIDKKNALNKKKSSIKREFKKRYPHLSHTEIQEIARLNGGYENIHNKNIETLITIKK